MGITTRIATVFGGTGFVGRYVVQALARQGYTVKIATRVPESAYFLRPFGRVAQIVPFYCDYKDPSSIDRAVQGSDIVINCIGILYERRRNDFRRIHVALPDLIAQSCARFNVARFIHFSAMGVDRMQNRYASTKLAGEQAVLAAFPAATILRPSVIFGEEDGFFNLFAGLAAFLPCLPLIGGGKTLFQPVYVGDVAQAVTSVLTLPTQGADTAQSMVYELGGPEIFSLKDIYAQVFEWTGIRRIMLSLPFALARIQAWFVQFIPPKPLLTPDQVVGMKTDNIVGADAAGFEALGIVPTKAAMVVPPYLERFRKGGRFADKKPA